MHKITSYESMESKKEYKSAQQAEIWLRCMSIGVILSPLTQPINQDAFLGIILMISILENYSINRFVIFKQKMHGG